MLSIEAEKNPYAREFCKAFLNAEPKQRLILGRNIYSSGIASRIEVGAFIDDFTSDNEFQGKPVIKRSEIPDDALVVSALLGKPFTGKKILAEVGAEQLDYFAFYEDCGLDLEPQRFWGNFRKAFEKNESAFNWIESQLSDVESKTTYSKILNFRLSGNLSYMDGFTDRQTHQYFEDFLALRQDGEIFVDAGGFDGCTSLEFIRRYPGYQAIYVFEPDERNMELARGNLANFENVHLIPTGLSALKGKVRFSQGGSISAITDEGEVSVEVDTLDHMVNDKVSFIKIDIEGAEGDAISGASGTISRHHPRLAICVYHRENDFWKIPTQVLSIRDDYKIFLRHYTEGVAETVMFFVPK